MIDKRFSLDLEDIDYRCIWIDDNVLDKSYIIINDTIKEVDLMEIVNLLNELNDENKLLKGQRALAQSVINMRDKRIEKLERENEQLKQFKEQVFELIDEKILECEKAVEDIRYNGKDSYIVKHDVASKLLKELKKELKE